MIKGAVFLAERPGATPGPFRDPVVSGGALWVSDGRWLESVEAVPVGADCLGDVDEGCVNADAAVRMGGGCTPPAGTWALWPAGLESDALRRLEFEQLDIADVVAERRGFGQLLATPAALALCKHTHKESKHKLLTIHLTQTCP